MRWFSQHVRTFLSNEEGPTAVEYAVIVGLVVLVCIGALVALGGGTSSTFTTAGTATATSP